MEEKRRGEQSGEVMISEQTKSGCMSRRTVLLATAGAAPLLVLGATGAQAAKLSQTAAR
jgi:hypothetical protein